LGVLVNVEDVLPLCDFHVPAVVRRGDLLLTASTGGQVPGLARALRETLADQFGPEWTVRLKELGLARAKWRSEGLSPREVSQNVRDLIVRMGWL
jgi:precorrin-2 dehydrogenase/sirohydrochlorin ferrochelatase